MAKRDSDRIHTEEMAYTKYERARMIGSRALQIAMGAPFFLKLSEKEIEQLKFNPVEIARREYDSGVLPITVSRPLPKAAGLEAQKKRQSQAA